MSLINKMLQDLEERRSEGEVANGMYGQVRAAAAPPRGLHPAWWIALLLAMLLVGAVSWFWGRQTAPGAAEQQSGLALKMAGDIRVAQAVPARPVPDKGAISPAPEARPQAQPQPALPSSQPVSNPPPAPAAQAAIPAPPATPVATPVAAAPAIVPDKPKAPVQAAPALAPVALAPAKEERPQRQPAARSSRQVQDKGAEFDIPEGVAKQITPSTPQQRADHEYRRAVALLQQGSAGEASRVLESVLQQDPQHVAARQALVGLLLEGRRQEEAIRRLQDGLALDKGQTGFAMMLARLQVDRGELRPAIETLQRSLSHAADRADYQAFLAALFQRDGRHKDAIEHYTLALRKAPQSGVWWMGIGISLQADNRSADAREAFARAKAANSLSPELQAFVEQRLNQLR